MKRVGSTKTLLFAILCCLNISALGQCIETEYIWVNASDRGVYRIHKSGNPITQMFTTSNTLGDIGFDSDGNLYGVDVSSGASGNFYLIDQSNGNLTTLGSMPTNRSYALTIDEFDYAYVGAVANSGGGCSDGEVYRTQLPNISWVLWHDFGSGEFAGDIAFTNGKFYLAWDTDCTSQNVALYEVEVDANNNYISHVNLGRLPARTFGLTSDGTGRLFGVANSRVYEIPNIPSAPAQFVPTTTVTTFNGINLYGAASEVESLGNSQLRLEADITDASCDSAVGSIDLEVFGAYAPFTVEWTDRTGNVISASDDLTLIDSSEYFLTVTDTVGCVLDTSFFVGMTPPIQIILIDKIDEGCAGAMDGNIQIGVTGGISPYQFLWTDTAGQVLTGTNTISGLEQGSYHIQITDASGCKSFRNYQINRNVPLELNLIDSIAESCQNALDGLLEIALNGGEAPYQLNWVDDSGQPSGNSSLLEEIDSGSYHIQITDARGCMIDSTFEIGRIAALELTLVGSDDPDCDQINNGSIDIEVSGGTPQYTYNWSNGSGSEDLQSLSSGVYTITLTDLNNCSVSLTHELIASFGPTIQFEQIDETCPGLSDGSIRVLVEPDSVQVSFIWSDGSTDSSLNDLSAGSYAVTASDINGCSASQSTQLISLNQLTLTPADDLIILRDSSALISATVSGTNQIDTAFWSPFGSIECAFPCLESRVQPESDQTFSIIVIDSFGCVYVDSMRVEIIDRPSVFIPNVFTPNADGINDIFEPIIEGAERAQLKIFSRWGEKVWQSPLNAIGWNGRFKGEAARTGVYVYYLDVTFFGGDRQQLKGSVTLLR